MPLLVCKHQRKFRMPSLVLLLVYLKMVLKFDDLPMLPITNSFCIKINKRGTSGTNKINQTYISIAKTVGILKLIRPLSLLLVWKWRQWTCFIDLRPMRFLLLPCLLWPWSERYNPLGRLALHLLSKSKKKNA